MAYPVQITLGTGNKVSVNYQSQEVNLSVTYQLERDDGDVLALAREKTGEVVAAHGIMWAQVRGAAKTKTPPPPKDATRDVTTGEAATEEEAEEPASAGHEEFLSGGQLNALESLLVQASWSQTQVEDHLLEEFGKSELTELSTSQATQLLLELQRAERERIQSNSQNRRSAPATRNGRG